MWDPDKRSEPDVAVADWSDVCRYFIKTWSDRVEFFQSPAAQRSFTIDGETGTNAAHVTECLVEAIRQRDGWQRRLEAGA